MYSENVGYQIRHAVDGIAKLEAAQKRRKKVWFAVAVALAVSGLVMIHVGWTI